MNKDAVRIAEQLRSQIDKRPAAVLVTPLEQGGTSRDIAYQVAQRAAASWEEKVLYIDVDAFRGEAESRDILWIEGKASTIGEADILEKQTTIESGLSSLKVRIQTTETGRQAFAPSFRRILELAKTHYAFIVIGSFSAKEEEIFSLIAMSDFCVVCLDSGTSSRTDFASFCRDCSLVADTPLGAVLKS